MPLADTFPGADMPVPRNDAAGDPAATAQQAFLEAIGGVLVDSPTYHDFSGAIDREVAVSLWTWIARDIAPEETAKLAGAVASGEAPMAAFDKAQPEIFARLKANAQAEKDDMERERRNTMQMGGETARKHLPQAIMAMRKRRLLEQAARFGAAVGVLADEAAIAHALGSISIANPVTRALWMQVMVGHMSNPSRTLAAAVSLSGGRDEVRVTNAGYAPLVDAVLSHAQGQIGKLAAQPSLFADIDFACKAIDRFHRLMRAVNYNVDIERKSLWGSIITDLVAKFSARLERPMREISPNVAQALRRTRDGADRVDPEQVLAALNGLYLLMTVRRSRDSLAVNALLDQAWTDTGQALEVLVTRALDSFRANPAAPGARDRLDAGIKMAEIRFNAEYADVLRRARDGADRRTAQG